MIGKQFKEKNGKKEIISDKTRKFLIKIKFIFSFIFRTKIFKKSIKYGYKIIDIITFSS